MAGAGAHEVVDSGYAGVAGFGVLALGVLTQDAAGERNKGSGVQVGSGLWAIARPCAGPRSVPPTRGMTYQRAPLASWWSSLCPLGRMHAPVSLRIGAR